MDGAGAGRVGSSLPGRRGRGPRRPRAERPQEAAPWMAPPFRSHGRISGLATARKAVPNRAAWGRGAKSTEDSSGADALPSSPPRARGGLTPRNLDQFSDGTNRITRGFGAKSIEDKSGADDLPANPPRARGGLTPRFLIHGYGERVQAARHFL